MLSDKLKKQLTRQQTEIDDHMLKVGTVESRMEDDRNAADQEMQVYQAESDNLQAQINALDKQLEI